VYASEASVWRADEAIHHPGLWRLLVRSRDVLGHAATRPADILVKLTR
jgi:hypothetical protein